MGNVFLDGCGFMNDEIKTNIIFNNGSFSFDYSEENTTENKYEFAYNLAFEHKEIENLSTQYLRMLSKAFIEMLIISPNIEELREKVKIEYDEDQIQELLNLKPFCVGSEYIDRNWIMDYYDNLFDRYKNEIRSFSGTVEYYFVSKDGVLQLPSKVYFHLVENVNSTGKFAFMITYSTLINEITEHYPIKYALHMLKDKEDEVNKIYEILGVLYKNSKFIKDLTDKNEIFEPIFISENEAYDFLKEIPLFKEAGVVCRVPNWWKNRKAKTYIEVDLKEKYDENKNGVIGSGILICPELIYNGLPISEEEINEIRNKTNGLAFIKGKWIEIDGNVIDSLLKKYESLKVDGTTLSEVVSLTTNLNMDNSSIDIRFKNNNWINEYIEKTFKTNPDYSEIPKEFNGTLRPYQMDGYKWLYGMTSMGFGLCLADDMGLGKTIQVLAFLEAYNKKTDKKVLLVLPASLIGNWENEIEKFAPNLKYYVARDKYYNKYRIDNSFLILTTYQQVIKIDYFKQIEWGIIILDEAQFIKNPDTLTARGIKSLTRETSIALTGTPIENNLINLWSIFDFINRGMLGTKNYFKKSVDYKHVSEESSAKLHRIINPFILRRLKSDKKIISDLPEKIEQDVYVSLSKKQIVLYNDVVHDVTSNFISTESEFKKKASILRKIMALKQICNHPSQYTGELNYLVEDSGKFQTLIDICNNIYENREKVVVFTQFKEIADKLDDLLFNVFHRRGFVITGEVPLSRRNEYIHDFQNENIPYIILTIKTAGYGINLTAANNAILFDRWWNPAVESQAIDRIFRIGQKSNVFIYKFISKETIEEAICTLLEVKQELSDSIMDDISGSVFGKMSSDEILKTIKYIGEYNEIQ